ncbi:hypothetical protein L195_g046403, partial [Trifolium pratense]
VLMCYMMLSYLMSSCAVVVPACVDDLVLKDDQLLMVDPLVSPCKSYGLLWYLQTIVQGETHGLRLMFELMLKHYLKDLPLQPRMWVLLKVEYKVKPLT